MGKKIALIIDDEDDIRALVSMTLARIDIECLVAANVHEAKLKLEEHRFHFCITDMKLPDGDGLEIIELCRKRYPDMPIALMTAHGNMDLGVHALKAGAFDVVAKPIDTNRLRNLAQDALQLSQMPIVASTPLSLTSLAGRSQIITDLKEQILKVARTQAPIFLLGEAGSGKGLVARLINQYSSRNHKPFIAISCSERNEQDLEKALFSDDNPTESLLYSANTGTLFLDDIEQLSPALQARLLRVLQEKLLWDTNHEKNYPIDFRILSASEIDLSTLVKNHTFKADLFFRINVIQINLPALRSHKEDILELANHFIHFYCEQWDMPTLTLTEEAAKLLENYSYPGNINELESILQRAVTLAESDQITESDLAIYTEQQDLLPPIHGKIDTSNLEEYLENIERRAVTQALASTRWNKTAAAEKLGISFRTLRYRCKKLGID